MKKAIFNSEKNIIEVSFSGSPELEDFMENANSIIEELKQTHCTKVLNDVSDLEINRLENQDWTQKHWFPEADKAGLKYFAFVVSKFAFGEISTEQTNEAAENEGKIKIKYFKTKEDAIDWLQLS